MTERLTKIISTFFYIGYFPLAPGSLASVAGMFIYFWLHQNIAVYILLWIVITVLGFKAGDKMEKIVGEKDPSCVVIDEVSGVMLAFFMLPLSWPVAWTGFFLFRAFDMFKIYPSNKLEKIPGGVGIMMDDIVAGIYTNITLQIALRLTS